MRKYFIALFCLNLFLIFVNQGFAQTQQLKFNLIKGSNGVSLGKINCIRQDKFGIIWLSDQTNRCIVKYDGNYMTRYQNDPKNPNSLGGYYPECLYPDAHGNIWVGFYNGMGLDKYDPFTNTFTHYRHNKNDKGSLANDTVSAILADHLGNIWVGTNGGLDLLDQKTGKFKHYRHEPNNPKSLSYNLVRAIYEDKAGELWIGTGIPFESSNYGGLNHFNRKDETFTNYLNDPQNPHSIINNKVRSIFEDSKGNFWIGTAGDGLHIMDRKTGLFTRYTYDAKNPERLSRPPFTEPIDHITFITEDAKGKIWIGTMFNGINQYDPGTKKIIHFGNDADGSGSFKDNSGWWAYASPDGQLWLTTQSANLYRIDLYNNTIKQYGKTTLDASFFFEESASVFWFLTNNGLIRKDFKSGTTRQYIHDPSNTNSLINNRTYEMIKDTAGNLWIATARGLDKFNEQTNSFTHYLNNPNDSTSLIQNNVNNLLQDHEGNIWIGTFSSGLDCLDTKTGKFVHNTNNPLDTNSISGNNISQVIEDETSDLWIGTYANSGLNRLNIKSNKFRHYLPGAIISDIYKDAEGIIWVATANGVFRYNRQADTFNPLAEDNPELQVHSPFSITGDNENNLWIGTQVGIYKLNQKRNHLQLFNSQNGIEGDQLFDNGAFKRQDGEIYFSNTFGYYAFYPEKINSIPGTSKIYLSGFWLSNEMVIPNKYGPLKEHLFTATEITLDNNQNIFSFGFGTIDFRNPR